MAVDLLRGLSPAQVDVVTSDAAPLAVVAGPGSGKTRVLTRRVAWRCRAGDVDPAHVLVLTFSRRAATELLDRLGRLGLPDAGRQAGVTAGTFHSVAWSEIARHRAERHQPAPAILGRPGRLLTPALAAVLGREPWRSEVAAAVAELGWARRQGGDADRYPGLVRDSARQPPLPPEVVAEAWRGYERAKRSRRVLDLDDLLGECTRLLSEDADAAAAARWRYRHVFVDEYQDLNPAHIRLLQAWVGGRPDVCLVGDPDQAVYGFNGASPDLFDRVSSDWPGVRILTLPENFRSTPEVVALAEAVRPTPAGAGPATVCRADHPDGCIAGSPEPGPSRQPPGLLPSIAAHTDDRAEAHAVAAAIAGRRAPGRPWGGMAVLARTNARLRLAAEALTAAGVPWRLRDPRPLADRPDVRSWLDAIPPTAPAADLAEVLADQPAAPDRDALSRALGEFRLTAPGGTVAALAAWLDATGVTADEAPVSGVDLATFHRAKGLEWKSVWVIGLEDGLVPLTSSTDPQSLAEEQRLLYVALTRAEDEIALSWAARRAGGGDVACPPSPWLADLAGVAAVLSRQPAPSDQRVRLAALRGGVPAVDAALVRRRRALTAWREARARAARVPPAVILSDEVVRALAGAAPVSESEIVRIGATAGPRVARWAPELVQVLSG